MEQTNMRNASAAHQLHALLDDLIAEASRKGCYGTCTLTFKVQDGIIQQDATADVERQYKLK